MPRFSDVFVFDSCGPLPDNPKVMIFVNCYLLKALGDKEKNSRVDRIMFDIEGMYLMIEDRSEMTGPFCLTVHT